MVWSCFPAQILQEFLRFPFKLIQLKLSLSCPSQRCWKECEFLNEWRNPQSSSCPSLGSQLGPGRMWWHFLLLFLPSFIHFPFPLPGEWCSCSSFSPWGEKERIVVFVVFLNCCFPTLTPALAENLWGILCYLHNKHLPCKAPSQFPTPARLESLWKWKDLQVHEENRMSQHPGTALHSC